MRSLLKFVLALVVAMAAMMAFRALCFTLYSVDSRQMAPTLQQGDRILVNRWSYGLRTGGEGLFSYGRICRQQVRHGDIVAFDCHTDSTATEVMIGRCRALPGEQTFVDGQRLTVPSVANCDAADCYLIEQLSALNEPPRYFGFVAEEDIIGRVVLVVYNHQPGAPLWSGYNADRLLLPL